MKLPGKRSIRLFCCIFFLGVMSAGVSLYYHYHEQENQQEEIPQQQVQEEPSEESMAIADNYEYILQEEDGYVVVYYADKQTVYATTSIKFSLLSQELREEIEAGKPVTDTKELYNFLEDYSS